MKILIALLCSVLGCAVFGAEEKTVPVMPNEVTLTTGRVLRNVQVIRWEKDRVVMKYTGGADPIPFSLIAEPLRAQLSMIREASTKAIEKAKAEEAHKREVAADISKARIDEQVKYSGQAFIVTRGAGSYKLAGMTVVIFSSDAWEGMKSIMTPKRLPKPLLSVTTDADGKFEFSLPKGRPFTLLAQGQRLANRNEEKYEWALRSEDMVGLPQILLSNDNHSDQQYSYKIDY